MPQVNQSQCKLFLDLEPVVRFFYPVLIGLGAQTFVLTETLSTTNLKDDLRVLFPSTYFGEYNYLVQNPLFIFSLFILLIILDWSNSEWGIKILTEANLHQNKVSLKDLNVLRLLQIIGLITLAFAMVFGLKAGKEDLAIYYSPFFYLALYSLFGIIWFRSAEFSLMERDKFIRSLNSMIQNVRQTYSEKVKEEYTKEVNKEFEDYSEKVKNELSKGNQLVIAGISVCSFYRKKILVAKIYIKKIYINTIIYFKEKFFYSTIYVTQWAPKLTLIFGILFSLHCVSEKTAWWGPLIFIFFVFFKTINWYLVNESLQIWLIALSSYSDNVIDKS